ncbi:hypothetical protein QQ056_08490 [Oscillatoria laete-virens NRMC-F 0139]|nr:hypothetical protein [Oscillatoria laete-virens]MDL5053580.1 hypothetical protein [Oscillatoria laete-virens NRMC-F 0139]
MHRALFILLWGLILASPASANPLGENEGEFMRQAKLLAQRGDYETALKAFNKLYDLNPKNTMARLEARRLQALKDKNPESFFLTGKLRGVILPEFKMNEAQYTAALKYLRDALVNAQAGVENPVQINMIVPDITPEPPPVTYSLQNISWWDAFSLVLQAAMLDCQLRDNTFVIKKAE